MDQRVRGVVLNNGYRYLVASAGDRLEELLMELPAPLRELGGECRVGEWYPLDYFNALNVATASLGSDAASVRAVMEGCGANHAQQGLNTFMKLLLRMLTPELFVKKFQTFFERDLDFGGEIETNFAADARLITIGFRRNAVVHAPAFATGLCRTILTAVMNKPVEATADESNLPKPVEFTVTLTWPA